MKKAFVMALGLVLLASAAYAGSCGENDRSFEEYRLVCAHSAEDLNRAVNGLKLSNKNWRMLGIVNIARRDNQSFEYCQMLYRYI